MTPMSSVDGDHWTASDVFARVVTTRFAGCVGTPAFAIADRRVHVGLDLGGAERAVVDADVVDERRRRSRPGCRRRRRCARCQRSRRRRRPRGSRPRRRRCRSGPCCRRNVAARCCHVPSDRVVAGVEVAREAAVERQVVARREMVDPDHWTAAGPRPDDAHVVLRRRLLHPGLKREAALVEGAEAAEADVVVRAVEGQRAAVAAAGRPGRADDRARVAVAGCVDRSRARSPRRTSTPRRGRGALQAGAAMARQSRPNTIASPKRISSVRSRRCPGARHAAVPAPR